MKFFFLVEKTKLFWGRTGSTNIVGSFFKKFFLGEVFFAVQNLCSLRNLNRFVAYFCFFNFLFHLMPPINVCFKYPDGKLFHNLICAMEDVLDHCFLIIEREGVKIAVCTCFEI